MALTDEGNGGIPATMLVGPANIGGGYPYPIYQNSGNGNNGLNGDGWWIILLLLLVGAGGWGNNGGGMGFGGGGAMNSIYPWMNQAEVTTSGFQNAALSGQLNGIQSGVQNLSTQLCNCCADMAQTVTSGFANAETAANARQIANMNQAFGSQMAMMQGFNSLGAQFADCCCENRLGIANLNSTILSENCADRAALAEGVRDIITNQSNNTQRILDQMCADKIDAKNEKIADLERQLTMANLAASQTAQTAQLQRGQIDATAALVNELRSCPIPSQPVYGSQPIFTCPNNNNNNCGCGCGMN